jgi:hypothetical protein
MDGKTVADLFASQGVAQGAGVEQVSAAVSMFMDKAEPLFARLAFEAEPSHYRKALAEAAGARR